MWGRCALRISPGPSLLVAGAGHCAVGAVAATGGLALFLVPDQRYDDCRNDEDKHNAYYNGRNMINKPRQHNTDSFPRDEKLRISP